VLVVLIAALPALLGLMGISVDVGMLYAARRRMQTAADAGAIAGAKEKQANNTAGISAAAHRAAAHNDFDETHGDVVSVHNPPASGEHAGDSNFVEVVIDQTFSTYFMKLLHPSPVTVRARAVAGMTPADSCVCVTHPTTDFALEVSSGSVLTATGSGCDVTVKSDNSKAMSASSGSCINSVASIQVKGGYEGSCYTPPPQTGSAANCEGSAPVPSVPGGCNWTNREINGGNVTLNPGNYCGGLKINGGTVTFNPGLYNIIGGFGFEFNGGSLIGSEVTFHMTFGVGYSYKELIINGGSANLSAPTSGAMKGYLIIQDPAAPAGLLNKIASTDSIVLNGRLYFPTQTLSFESNTTAQVQSLVANRLAVASNSTLQMTYSGASGAGQMGLVE
jgi:Flp pilus assembly protein TadG